ncbi:MAG TPA: hypothetical protein DD379_01530 [Cyanobacteria bacterium UBA11162]|nr:hypothetical protein [Cyanobacteria bacterium UBA11162]
MSEPNQDQVYLVTSVVIALDEEDGVFIAGILSDAPFKNNQQESAQMGNIVGNFAFTRRQAKFLRDRINEFLQE